MRPIFSVSSRRRVSTDTGPSTASAAICPASAAPAGTAAPALQPRRGGVADLNYSGGTLEDQPNVYGDYEGEEAAVPEQPVVQQRRVEETEQLGRNDPCWCGSGKKYKKCHGA